MTEPKAAYGPTRWRHGCLACGRRFFTFWRYAGHRHTERSGTLSLSLFNKGLRRPEPLDVQSLAIRHHIRGHSGEALLCRECREVESV